MGQTPRYTYDDLHPIRYFGSYVYEVKAGGVDSARAKELHERFVKVKVLAKQMFCDAYILIQKLDGEPIQDPEYLWNLALKWANYRTAKDADGNYSDEKLHPMRHFEEYVADIDAGNLKDKKKIRNRLACVIELAPEVYRDVDQLLKELV